MPNKTILHLTGMTSTKYGGVEHYLVELISLCNQKGYRTILQYETPPQSQAYLHDLESLGAKVIVLTTHVNLLQSVQRITTLLYSTRPEIFQIHFGGRYIRFIAPLIARILGVQKIISLVHSMHHLKEKSPRRFALNQYDHVLGVSNTVANNLRYAGVNPKIVSTHYLGLFGKRERCQQLRFQFRNEFGIPEDAVVIACIAFDHPVKGLDILLDAFKEVHQNHTQAHLIIVGVDPDHSALPKQAANLGLAGYVHWAGIRDEGWKILNAADIYVQPSRSEGLGLAIVEAMALHLPVVATRTGGIPEVVVNDETGYLADYATADSQAAAIERILTEPSRWKAMGEAGYSRYSQLFKGDKSVREMVEKYFELTI